MPKQKVGKGESVSSLAKKNGFFWKTIWDHPENAELKAKRKDPSLLFEDDEIFIPDMKPKELSKAGEQTHTFKRKGEPCKIKIQLLKLGKPRANEDYVIEIEGKQITGKTDGDGQIEQFIPGESQNGKLILRGGKEEYPLKIGYLDPVDEIAGVKQRLNNLGYPCGSEDAGELEEKAVEALKMFQAEQGLEVTGKIDNALKAKLKELSK